MATAVRKPYPPIPDGMADFSMIRREGYLYVDKTRFLHELEKERHVFLLRPRLGTDCGRRHDCPLTRATPMADYPAEGEAVGALGSAT